MGPRFGPFVLLNGSIWCSERGFGCLGFDLELFFFVSLMLDISTCWLVMIGTCNCAQLFYTSIFLVQTVGGGFDAFFIFSTLAICFLGVALVRKGENVWIICTVLLYVFSVKKEKCWLTL